MSAVGSTSHRTIAAPSGSEGAFAPVFVYSGYRSSSTWLWSKFRENPKACAYYEPFNEGLATISADTLQSVSPESWRSHHPSSGGYWAEYAPLLAKEPGVPLFPLGDQNGERFMGAAGIEGTLDPDVHSYAASLIAAAQERRRVPVLACTRMLGRAAGFRNAFGGHHFLLVRNLFQQWISYSGQYRFGNDYFLRKLYSSVQAPSADKFITHIQSYFSDAETADFSDWMTPTSHDRVFCFFVAYQIYVLMVSRRQVDLVIDVNRLARSGPSYRLEVAEQVATISGLSVDLSDARESVDYPYQTLRSVDDCRMLLRAMVDRLLVEEARGEDDRSFIEGLVSDLWEEHARFTAMTAGAAEVIAVQQARAEDDARRLHELEVLEAETAARLAELDRQSMERINELTAAVNAERASGLAASATRTETQAAVTLATEQLEAALQDIDRLQRRAVEEASAHCSARDRAESKAAEASTRLEEAKAALDELQTRSAEQARDHGIALKSAEERIAATERECAKIATQLETLQQDRLVLVRENGRLEGQYVAQSEAHSARLADAEAANNDLTARLGRAEQALFSAQSDVAELRGELAYQAKCHLDDLAKAEQLYAIKSDAFTVELDGVRQQAASDILSLNDRLAQLQHRIEWRESQLRAAVTLLDGMPQPLVGRPALLAALIRPRRRAAEQAVISKHREAFDNWHRDLLLPLDPKVLQEQQMLLDNQTVSLAAAVEHGGIGIMESDEPVTSVPALLAPHDRAFIHTAYRAVLGRAPDLEGEAYYLARIRAGNHKLAILKQLRRSQEGRKFIPGVAGLDRAIKKYRWATLPVLGVMVRLLLGEEGNGATHRALRVLANDVGRLRSEQTRFQTEQASLARAMRELSARSFGEADGAISERPADLQPATQAANGFGVEAQEFDPSLGRGASHILHLLASAMRTRRIQRAG